MDLLAQIPPVVQRRWLTGISVQFDRINQEQCGGKLRRPQVALSSRQGDLGRYDRVSRTMYVGVEHLLRSTWHDICVTIRHEMAHMVVSELYGAPNAPSHGDLFARACRMLKVTPEATGPVASSPAQDKIGERIKKLLRLAQSDNPNEAQLAMSAAQKLLLQHNLDLASVDRPGTEDFICKCLGEPLGRVSLEHKMLSGILETHFFVRCIWIRSSRVVDGRAASQLEVTGRRHNVAMAEYVHAFVLRTLEDLVFAWRTERYYKRLPTSRTDINDYRNGVVMGFSEHLEAQRSALKAEGLVWVGDAGVDAFYDERHPSRASMARGHYRLGEAHDAGKDDGRAIRLRGGLDDGGAVSRGRLLGGG